MSHLHQLLMRFNQPVPRYTSYPTAPEWEALPAQTHRAHLLQLAQKNTPLSLYFHIPFCKSMCLYCGCSVILNRKEENEVRYVDYLIKEIEYVRSFLEKKKKVVQLHFGGGTPTKLAIPHFARLLDTIFASFEIDPTGEIAIEVDPRTVVEDQGAKLRFLKQVGFNRISFGVQDTDPKVQEAVKRRQSLEMTESTYALARSLGFKGINIDLIYGLPYQSTDTFDLTVSHILRMRPDRIAFFSYAKIPWLKPHQKAIPEEALPSVEDKFRIYASARSRFVENGYVAIGMDHFALETDELAESYRTKTMQRNFQGYSLKLAEDTLGFGVTAIGFFENAYFQNAKELNSYYSVLDQGHLPVHKGKILTQEDRLRKWVIHTLMCDFQLDKKAFSDRFHEDFDVHFEGAAQQLAHLEMEGLIVNQTDKLRVTSMGELMVRMVAMTFDAYLKPASSQPKFSQSV